MNNRTFRRSSLSASIALALGAFSFQPIMAQDAADADVNEDEGFVEEVIVTGVRKSLIASMDRKRDAIGVVDAITAEDFGDFPDTNLAEALQRIPGVSIDRFNGEGSRITVRGLGPDFTTALMNGRPQVSSGDNRGVEFDQYPSEMISQAVVYKTPDAQLMGQGLAGTVDMQTIRPLAYGKEALVVNARYIWNDIDALIGTNPATAVHLTEPQSCTQFNLWSLLSAQLIIGGSILKLNAYGADDITNIFIIIAPLSFIPSFHSIITSLC